METIKYILTGFAFIIGLCCVVVFINDNKKRNDYAVVVGFIILMSFISYIIGYSIFHLQIPTN